MACCRRFDVGLRDACAVCDGNGGEPAGIFRFEDRGVLRPGAFADICVFEPDRVGPGKIRRVRDFPATPASAVGIAPFAEGPAGASGAGVVEAWEMGSMWA